MADEKLKPLPITADELTLKVQGDWLITGTLPSVSSVIEEVRQNNVTKITFDSDNLQGWDSSLLTFILELEKQLAKQPAGLKINIDLSGLPDGARQLYSLSKEVPRKEDAEKDNNHLPVLERIGEDFLDFLYLAKELLAFIGDIAAPFYRLFSKGVVFRWNEFGVFLQETGVYAVPIVSLISFLFGVILAFVGIMQLKLFGAQVYVADLVGIATVRIMGAVMTGIIMAGRTGAAFAAQLGTMQVNEEIDALKTLGICPVQFLVLPRMIALTLMMPLLTLFANLMGIFGGGVVASGVYNINAVVYVARVSEAVTLNDLVIGIFAGTTFGVLISMAGCLRGLECGRDASAVGDATTSAVVTSIVAIIIDTAIIIIVTSMLGI